MLDLLGADQKTDIKALTAEVIKQLDSSHDGKITKTSLLEVFRQVLHSGIIITV